jgi:hypothetical protein
VARLRSRKYDLEIFRKQLIMAVRRIFMVISAPPPPPPKPFRTVCGSIIFKLSVTHMKLQQILLDFRPTKVRVCKALQLSDRRGPQQTWHLRYHARTLSHPTIRYEVLEYLVLFHANCLNGPQDVHCVILGTHVSRPNPRYIKCDIMQLFHNFDFGYV